MAHGGGKVPAKILEAARGMAWMLWPALAPEDTLIIPAPPPAGFLDYLTEQGLTPPHFCTEAEVQAKVQTKIQGKVDAAEGALDLQKIPDVTDALFTPFGWNEDAARLNADRNLPASHPDPEIVRRVNSRAFGLELERRLFPESACPATLCLTRMALAEWLTHAPPGRYLAKGNYGHAGIGQLRFELPDADLSLQKKLRRLLERHAGLVMEERQEIEQEWGVLFRVGAVPGPLQLRVHRLLSDSSGGYAGALVLSKGQMDTAWQIHKASITDAVQKISQSLRDIGYFGPVGIDVYTHRSADGVTHLRNLVDLNARLTMAWPVHGLARRFPDRAILLRHFSTSALRAKMAEPESQLMNDKLSWPQRLDGLSEGISEGVAIWLTPQLPLTRHAMVLFGESESDVLRKDDTLRKRLNDFKNWDACL